MKTQLQKPVVKYRKNRINPSIRYKLTLLTTIKGPKAKELSDAHSRLFWSYDTKKQELEIYKEEILDQEN